MESWKQDNSAMPSKAERKKLTNLTGDVLPGIVKTSDLNLVKKGDYKPEVFFIGQIVLGKDFHVEQDGLFVEASLQYGEDWGLLDADDLSGPI